MENRMKLRLSRMFRASFGSCRTRNIPDVIENAVFIPQDQTHVFRVFDPPPPSPKPRSFPSVCKPQTGPRQKVSDRYYSPLGFADTCGSTCTHVSPISPFMYYKKERKKSKDQRSGSKHKSKKSKKPRVKSTNREARLLSSSSRYDSAYYSWLSSDDEDDDEEMDTHTLFSSRSTTLSSDSSGSLLRKSRCSRRMKRRERVGPRNREIGGSNALPLMDGRVKDSFAVVKKSSDPYNDFRTSMVEMIVEKQIFGAQDLEKLLQLFISLNSDCHHRIIVEVFTEIWEALFSDWS
ncbi:pinin-like [Tripterygium wilfordii]|uniref:Transcription repressor n=1 Tax=Tripterygium wilfordii TaxID=458696 RepID=A0A7J7DQJ0_TRIWF|nr:transcription repressor OFP8 [Tripterygium wilfordii]KAF5748591.1 pinin-like [Tripterygium wilfordii]